MPRPNPTPGRDRRIEDTYISKPTLDIFFKNWAKSPLCLGLFRNTNSLPVQITQTHKTIGNLGILRMHPIAHNIRV